MKTFASLHLFVFCAALFMFCRLLYPTMLDAQMSTKEAERTVQKFEQVKLKDLLKDESLYLEYERFHTDKLVNTFFLLDGAFAEKHTKEWKDWEDRFESLNLRMSKILTKVGAVKSAEQGDINARVYLAAHKIDNMLDLAIFRQEFDKFEQIQRDKLWNVSAFGEFIKLYVDVKFKEDFIFFEFDSLHRLEQKEYDVYVDRINKIALSVVEWVEGLEFDVLKPKEKKDFRETSKEFSKLLKI